MPNIYIKKTTKTPEVSLNVDLGEFKLAGRSITENPKDFYEPILHELERYALSPLKNSLLELYFEYLSTTSSIYIMRIMAAVKKIGDNGYDIAIVIKYEDDDPDMLDKFQAMSQIVKVDAVYTPITV